MSIRSDELLLSVYVPLGVALGFRKTSFPLHSFLALQNFRSLKTAQKGTFCGGESAGFQAPARFRGTSLQEPRDM